MTTKIFNNVQTRKIKNKTNIYKILSHQTRVKILIMSCKEEGCSTKEIQNELKLNKKTYDFHIRELRKTEAITSQKTENDMFFFANPRIKATLIANELI